MSRITDNDNRKVTPRVFSTQKQVVTFFSLLFSEPTVITCHSFSLIQWWNPGCEALTAFTQNWLHNYSYHRKYTKLPCQTFSFSQKATVQIAQWSTTPVRPHWDSTLTGTPSQLMYSYSHHSLPFHITCLFCSVSDCGAPSFTFITIITVFSRGCATTSYNLPSFISLLDRKTVMAPTGQGHVPVGALEEALFNIKLFRRARFNRRVEEEAYVAPGITTSSGC